MRFHFLANASGRIEKVSWRTLKDGGTRQFDFGESPIYIRGPKDLKATPRPDPVR